MLFGEKYHQRLKLFISAALFAWTLLVFLPGSYSVDSWSQYDQMIHGRYDDWFGPAMPFIWHVLWLATGSYVSLYLLQMLLYWGFVTLLVWPVKMTSVAFWIIITFSFFLCFIPQYIMRDSLAALCWGIGALLLFSLQNCGKNNKFIIFIIIILLEIGLWVRPNGVVAIIPLVWAGLVIINKKRLATWKYLLMTISIVFFLFMSTQFVTYQVLHTSRAYPSYKLKLLDITGISKLSGKNYFPSCIRSYKTFNYDSLLNNYTPASFDDIYWPANNRISIVPYPDAALNDCLNKSWLSAITNHPLLYLQNRTVGYLYYLHIRKRFKSNDYWNVSIWIDPKNPLNLKPEANKMRDNFSGFYTKLSATFIYDPWFWLLVNIVCFFFFVYKNKRVNDQFWQIHACIQLTGIIFMLSQFPIYQHDRDFRYSYWNVFVTLIAFSAFPSTVLKFKSGMKEDRVQESL